MLLLSLFEDDTTYYAACQLNLMMALDKETKREGAKQCEVHPFPRNKKEEKKYPPRDSNNIDSLDFGLEHGRTDLVVSR